MKDTHLTLIMLGFVSTMGLSRYWSHTRAWRWLLMRLGLYLCEPCLVILLWFFPQPVPIQFGTLLGVPMLWAFWPQLVALRGKILPFMAENGRYLLWGFGVIPILLLIYGFLIIRDPVPVGLAFSLALPAFLVVHRLPNPSERNAHESRRLD